jgi:hypothetical protein
MFLMLLRYYREGESGDCDIEKHPFLYHAERSQADQAPHDFVIYSEKDGEAVQ